MDGNSTSNGSLYDLTSFSKGDDDVDEFFVAHVINEYDRWSPLDML